MRFSFTKLQELPKAGNTALMVKKISRWQMPAQVHPVSILEAKYLQVLRGTTRHSYLCWQIFQKHVQDCSNKSIFAFCWIFGRGSVSFFFFFENHWAFDVSIMCYKHVYFWQKHSAQRMPAMTVLREISRNLKRIYLGKYLHHIVLTNSRSWFFSILLLYLHSKSFHML